MNEDRHEIEPGLWLGSAVDVVPDGIDCIVNLVEGTEPAFCLPQGVFVRLLFAPIPDGLFRGLNWLDATVDTIVRWRREGRTVLVHCAAGVSRSAMVVAAVLMKKNGVSRDKALETIAGRRPQIHPNSNFLCGLRDYEQMLRLGRTFLFP